MISIKVAFPDCQLTAQTNNWGLSMWHFVMSFFLIHIRSLSGFFMWYSEYLFVSEPNDDKIIGWIFLRNCIFREWVFWRPFVKRFALCYQTIVLSVTLVYCGQIVGWIKMPLDTKVGDIVLVSEDPAPPQKGAQQPPHFSTHVYCGQTAGYIKMPLGMEVGLSPGDTVLHGNPAPPPVFSEHANFAAWIDVFKPDW